MAAKGRQQTDSLIAQLVSRPYGFDFFEFVRRLECSLPPEAPRIGYSVRPVDDPIRFCQVPSLAFAPSTLAGCVPGEGGRPPKLYVNFFGLLGPNGPMPLHFTEYVRSRQLNHGDFAIARFLDLFHHRMISFFYRAWAAGQQTVSCERQEGLDQYAVYVGSLFGMGMGSLRHRDEIGDVAKMYYAGRLACYTRNAEGLQAILQDYFGVPAQIEQFVGQWLELPDDCRCRLGESPVTGKLGLTTIVGRRTWECQLKFRIIIGPVTLAAYRRFLPGQESLRRLAAWVRRYAGEGLDWDVQLVLVAGEVPGTVLGGEGMLGWTTWLVSGRMRNDARDLVLSSASRGIAGTRDNG